MTDVKVLDQAVAYLNQEFAKTSGNDHETRAALLHALSTRHAASFEAANSLNRVRNELSDPALAYLALTFANLDRVSLAGELIGILGPRAKTEATAPGPAVARLLGQFRPFAGDPRRRRDDGAGHAWPTLASGRRPPSSTGPSPGSWPTAPAPAGSRTRPRGRRSPPWRPIYGRAQRAEDRYRLTVTVNDTQVAELNVAGTTEGQAIAVPRKAIKVGQPNRVRFEMEGRGRFGYAVTLAGFTRDFGPDQDSTNRVASINRRVYLPAAPGARRQGACRSASASPSMRPTFENLASQVALGGRGPRRASRPGATFPTTRPNGSATS